MKASICGIIVVVAYAATTFANPIPEEGKVMKDQLRQKRQHIIYTEPLTTTYLGAQRTILTAPVPAAQVVHTSVPSTQVVHTAIATPQVVHTAIAAPAPVRVAVPAAPTHSFVYQSGPDYSYYIHQRHPSSPAYYYDPYYYPAVSSVPVQVYG